MRSSNRSSDFVSPRPMRRGRSSRAPPTAGWSCSRIRGPPSPAPATARSWWPSGRRRRAPRSELATARRVCSPTRSTLSTRHSSRCRASMPWAPTRRPSTIDPRGSSRRPSIPTPKSLSIALAANAGRTFVIAAIGFDAGSHTASAAARNAELDAFLKRFAWDGQPLFASAALGFEAPALTAPAVVKLDAADPAAGSVAFRDLTSDPAIRVDVGTQMAPAWPPVDGSRRGHLVRYARWAAGGVRVSLGKRHVDDQSRRGRRARHADRASGEHRRGGPPGPRRARLRHHDTTATASKSPAPEFDEFLRQFRFVGRSSNGS